MRITLLFTFLLSFLNTCTQKEQVSIESTITEIEFNNPYKFNSTIEERLKKDTLPWKHQTALLSYQKKGDYKKTLELLDLDSEKKATIPLTTEQIDSIKSKYTPLDAGTFISRQARSRKVVIINEAHHNPSHRTFTRSLLKELYSSGYTYLGLEALYNGPQGGTPLGNNGNHIKDEKDSLLNTRNYPIFQSGNYLEPQMGNLIRLALEIGFTVFSYEKTGVGSGNPRELGQAKNIQQILEKEPNAKILIHCGFAHAYEGYDVYGSKGKAMAGWLNELTGIDPLTINQVVYSEEYSKPEFNNPLPYALSISDSKVLVDKEGNPMKFVRGNAYTDIVVVHPPTEYINEKPSWLFKYGYEDVVLDISELDINFPVMVIAYNRKENISHAIPIDIVELNNKTTLPHLSLTKGEFTIVVANKDGIARKFDISVK